jgi:Nuclease-related domain
LPNDVINWERGAKGEQSTARHLQGLAEAGFISFSNRGATGLKGDIDAIVVGPTGVYVVETKTTKAKVEIIRDRTLTGDYQQDWADQATREAMAIQIGLRDLLDPLHRTVVPIVCVYAKGPGVGRTAAGVRLVSAAQLVGSRHGTAMVDRRRRASAFPRTPTGILTDTQPRGFLTSRAPDRYQPERSQSLLPPRADLAPNSPSEH